MALDLDIDLGELADEPDELYRLCTVANVACGGHAGDEGSMLRACLRAGSAGVRVMAHPSYVDRAEFGRSTPEWVQSGTFGQLEAQLEAQLRDLLQAASAANGPVLGLKAHGALYHDVERIEGLAALLVRAGNRVLGSVAFVGAPGGRLEAECRLLGLDFVREGFADRGYEPSGRLVPRGQPGALLDAEDAALQAVQLAASGRFDSLCVHGDGPRALQVARAVRAGLSAAGFLMTAAALGTAP